MIDEMTTKGFGLETTLRHAVDGMLIIDRNRTVVFYSEACERILGADRASAIGRSCPCHEITNCRDEHGRSLFGVLCPATRVLSGEVPSIRQRMSVVHGHGRRVWVESTYSPIKDDDGNIIGAVGIMRDMTEATDRVGSENPAGDSVTPNDLDSTTEPLDQKLSSIERREILGSLGRARGQRTLAARMLGISRSRLYRRMEALGINPRRMDSTDEPTNVTNPVPSQPGLPLHAPNDYEPRQE